MKNYFPSYRIKGLLNICIMKERSINPQVVSDVTTIIPHMLVPPCVIRLFVFLGCLFPLCSSGQVVLHLITR